MVGACTLLQVTITDAFGIILAEKTISLDRDIISGGEGVAFLAQVELEVEIGPDQVTDIIVIPLQQRSSR